MKNHPATIHKNYGSRVDQHVYFFPSQKQATDFAEAMKIPSHRIFQFEQGWAIQRNILGPYFGPKGWWPDK